MKLSEINLPILEYIVKVKGGYRVYSHQTHKNFGTYPTKAKAKARLKQMKRFRGYKKKGKKKKD